MTYFCWYIYLSNLENHREGAEWASGLDEYCKSGNVGNVIVIFDRSGEERLKFVDCFLYEARHSCGN